MYPFNQNGVGKNSAYWLKMKPQQYIKSSTTRNALHRLGYKWASINCGKVYVHAEKPRFVGGEYANGVDINTFPNAIRIAMPPLSVSTFDSLQKIEI